MMYKPLKFFCAIGAIIFSLGIILGGRYIVLLLQGAGDGHVQSLILTAILLMIGFQTFIVGLLADIIASNRKLLEDIQYRVRKMECEPMLNENEKVKENNEHENTENKKVVNYY